MIGHRVLYGLGRAQDDFPVLFADIAAELIDHPLGPKAMPTENDDVTR